MASFLDLPVDSLGDIGKFLCSRDRRSLSRASRGLRRAAVSLWPDDVAVTLRPRVVHAMSVDAAFCTLVRDTLLGGPLAPLSICVVEEPHTCRRRKWQTVGAAAAGFAIEDECYTCGVRDALHVSLPAASCKVVSGFYRVDVRGTSAVDVSRLVALNMLVLVGCGVADVACLAESTALRKLALSQCDAVAALPRIPQLQRAEIRCCRSLESVDALAHVRAVVLEGCEAVRDVSSLADVHAVTIERRVCLTDVSALFLGRVHTLVLDHVGILPLPEGARVHSLALECVRVGAPHAISRRSEQRVALRARPGFLTGAVRRDEEFERYSGGASLDLARLSVSSLSLCNRPLPSCHDDDDEDEDGDGKAHRTLYCDRHTAPICGHGLACISSSVHFVLPSCRPFDLSWARNLSIVAVTVDGRWAVRSDKFFSLAPLVTVPRVIVRGSNDRSVHGLLPAVAFAMQESRADVRVQRRGCGALAGRQWSIGAKRDCIGDQNYADAVLGAIATFPTDEAVVRDGLVSLTRMVGPSTMSGEDSRVLGWVRAARACLDTTTSPACVAAALSLLLKAMAHAYSTKEDPKQGLRDALRLDEMALAAVRAAGTWADDNNVLAPAVEIFDMCATLPLLAGSGRAAAASEARFEPYWVRRLPKKIGVFPGVASNIRNDRSWVPAAVRAAVALGCRRGCFHRRAPSRELPMDLLATVADIDEGCARELVAAGALDMLLDCAVASLSTPFRGGDAHSWVLPLGRLAQYARDAGPHGAPPLLSAGLMFDVARRVSRWATDAGCFHSGLLELLLAGVPPFPPREAITRGTLRPDVARTLLVRRAVRRHRLDPDLAVGAALAFNFSLLEKGGNGANVDGDILAALGMYIARTPRMPSPVVRSLFSVEGIGEAIGRAGGGFAFLSAALRAALYCRRNRQRQRDVDWNRLGGSSSGGAQCAASDTSDTVSKHLHWFEDSRRSSPIEGLVGKHVRALASGVCELVAASEDGGGGDAVDAALWDCVACLERCSLWLVDASYRSSLQDVACSAALLLFAKCRPDRNQVAPSTLCALAVTAAMGIETSGEQFSRGRPAKLGRQEKKARLEGAAAVELRSKKSRTAALRAFYAAIEAIVAQATHGAVRASVDLLSLAARVASPDYRQTASDGSSRKSLADAAEGSAASEVRVARSLLAAVARGGLLIAEATGKQTLRYANHGAFVGAATLLALCALDGRQRAFIVDDATCAMHSLRLLFPSTLAVEVQAASAVALDEFERDLLC